MLAPPSESEEIYRESRSGQGASLAGKSHARKKIYTVLEKVTFRTAKGRYAPFFLPQEGKNSKKRPENRAHLEKATLHHCDRGTPSCQRRGGTVKKYRSSMATLQAMVDAGYRAGKRAERARRKVQTAA